MGAAGFRASASPVDDPDYVVVVYNGGGVWVRESDPALVRPLLDWLRQQDWCGPVFTRDGLEGTLRQAELCADHPRAADVVLALAHDGGNNQWGRAGLSADNAPYPEHGGCHGGLSRYELENFIAMGGSAFRAGAVTEAPAGNVDLQPTVLGVGIDHAIDGQVLAEALAGGAADGAAKEVRLTSSNGTGLRTYLDAVDYGGTRYLNRAWTE